MPDRNGAGTGDLTIAGPLSSVICGDAHGIAQPQSKRKARPEEAKRGIAELAQQFPSAFVVGKSKPRRPLKIGIAADLVAAGLAPHPMKAALRSYTSHTAYLQALAAGGPRYDLNGNAAGEVTPDQAEHAAAEVARLEPMGAVGAQSVMAKAAQKAKVKATKPPASGTPPAPPPSSNNTAPKRDGLAALRKAALARKGA